MFSNPSDILKAKLREHIEEIKDGPSVNYLGKDEESKNIMNSLDV